MREHCFWEGSQASAVGSGNGNVKMSMEQWWNGTDRGKLKYWEKNIIQCGW